LDYQSLSRIEFSVSKLQRVCVRTPLSSRWGQFISHFTHGLQGCGKLVQRTSGAEARYRNKGL
jgi:hypothetical protein